MAIPSRNSNAAQIVCSQRTFFVTAATWGRRRMLQSERMARLLIEVLYHYRAEQKYRLHEFVVMPDHLHVLLSVGSDLTIERAVQFIKGAFSYRARKEFAITAEMWQRGFSEVRILTKEQFTLRQIYIRGNPLRAHLVSSETDYLYSSANPVYELDFADFTGAKAPSAAQTARHG